LFYAAKYGHSKIVELLCQMMVGESINESDYRGFNPCELSAVSGHSNITMFLISKGANPNRRGYIN